MLKKSLYAITLLLAAASTAPAITIDGDFSDFTADMIVASDDGSGTGLYLVDVRVTNDNNYIYVNYNYSMPIYAGSTPAGIFSAFDIDLALDPDFTGFPLFGAGFGTDAAFQNDFPFQEAGNGTNELFNANGQMLPAGFLGGPGVGGLKTAGGDPLYGTFSALFDDGVTPAPTGVEFSIAIDGTLGNGVPLFTFGKEFGIVIGIDGLNASVLTGTYTPVAVPEPISLASLSLGGLALLWGRRRRQV